MTKILPVFGLLAGCGYTLCSSREGPWDGKSHGLDSLVTLIQSHGQVCWAAARSETEVSLSFETHSSADMTTIAADLTALGYSAKENPQVVGDHTSMVFLKPGESLQFMYSNMNDRYYSGDFVVNKY